MENFSSSNIKFILVFVFLLEFHEDVKSQILLTRPDSCINIFRAYSNHWKKDRVGKNGFREIFGEKFLVDCNCEGRFWNDLREYLGNPNYTYLNNDSTTFRYRLNHTKNFKDVGSYLLDIIVDNTGVIVFFSVWRVDG
jgi:hypothetical protein